MSWFDGRGEKKTSPSYYNTVFRLSDMKPGDVGIVTSVCGNSPIRRRIIDMGITLGVEIQVVKLAPLGDPLEIRLRGYQLSLRKSDANEIYLTHKDRDINE